MKKYLFGLLFVAINAHAQCVGDTAGAVRSVYVVPQTANSALYVAWVPILEQIGRDTRQCFELYVPQSIPEFETALLNNQADYAFMNPYHLVMANRARGYVPLVTDSQALDGVIVVRKDSPIKSIEQLNNATMAFPAPNAFAASLLIRSTLANQNILAVPKYVNTHSNVYRSVILGDVVAGGGVNHTLDRESPAVRDKLRILYRTKSYNSHPFSANPRIPESTRQAVADSFIRLNQTEQGRALLDRVQLANPKRVTYNDYAPLEKLNLERFVHRANN